MLGVDTNVLVYAHRKDLEQHDIAYDLLSKLCSETKLWAIAWPSLYEFYRLVTHKSIFKKPSRRTEALDFISALHKVSSLKILSHASSHWDKMKILCNEADVIGTHVFDVQIAAIFLEHGIEEVITNDSDFLRFRVLKVTNPFS